MSESERQAGGFEEFIKEHIKGKRVNEARRFTVDSIDNRSLRILVAALARPIEKSLAISGLASVEAWEEEREEVVTRRKAAEMIGVAPADLLERRVFIRIKEHTFDITQLVRQERKKLYASLLSREILRPRFGSEESR